MDDTFHISDEKKKELLSLPQAEFYRRQLQNKLRGKITLQQYQWILNWYEKNRKKGLLDMVLETLNSNPDDPKRIRP